ncbi:7151_t:CDS:1, partial [Gigaspora rosea]
NEIIEIINCVIGDIDQSTLEKINETIALPIDQLIAPSINRRGRQIPRPQNSFILYRRNLNAVTNNRNDVKSEFNFISKEASINWSKESNEAKQLYELLADYTKQVHNLLYPDYSYKPKRKNWFKIQSFPLIRVGSRKKKSCASALPPLIYYVGGNFTNYDKNIWCLVDKHLINNFDFFIQLSLYPRAVGMK